MSSLTHTLKLVLKAERGILGKCLLWLRVGMQTINRQNNKNRHEIYDGHFVLGSL
jgi:hypothetical protein